MSMMTCTVCGVGFAHCTCPDLDARLKAASDEPHVMFKWCEGCDRHYARCLCGTPRFYLRSHGQKVEIPTEGFTTAAGTRIVPDLTKR